MISAHLAVLTAQKAFDIRYANERRLKAHTEAEKIRLAAGTSTPTRMAEAEARLARAQSDKIVAESNLQTAFETYQSLTDLHVMSLMGFEAPIGLPNTMADAEEEAVLSHPSVIIADLTAKSASLQLEVLKQSVLPKIDFSLSATQTDRDGSSFDKNEVTANCSYAVLVTEATRSASKSSRRAMLSSGDAAESRRVVRLSARRAFHDPGGAQLSR